MKKLLLPLVACTLMLVACNKANNEPVPSLSSSSVEMKSDETKKLTLNDEIASNWQSENKFVAQVDADGLVTAKHIGKTKISVNANKQVLFCEVMVNPVYSTYQEPFMSWGGSKSKVKAFEKRTLSNETSTSLTYSAPRTLGVVYLFTNDALKTSGVVLPLTFDAKELVGYLSERYEVTGTAGDYFTWRSEDKKTAIVVAVENNGIIVMYTALGNKANMISETECSAFSKAASFSDEERLNVINKISEAYIAVQ